MPEDDGNCYSLEILKEKHARLQDGFLQQNPSTSTAGDFNVAGSTPVSVLRQNHYHRQDGQKSELTVKTGGGDTRGMLFDSSHDNYHYHSRELLGEQREASQPDMVTLMPRDGGGVNQESKMLR